MSKRSTQPGLKATLLAACATLLLAGSALPTLAATSEQEKSDKFYREAQEYLKKRDANAAVIQLKNALKSDPGNIQARLLLAEVYMRLGQGNYAEKELKAAEQRGAPFADIMVDLGRSLMMQGRFDDVLNEESTHRQGPRREQGRTRSSYAAKPSSGCDASTPPSRRSAKPSRSSRRRRAPWSGSRRAW